MVEVFLEGVRAWMAEMHQAVEAGDLALQRELLTKLGELVSTLLREHGRAGGGFDR